MRRLAITLVFAILLVFSNASSVEEELHLLFKRDSKLPYDTLPNANCTAPSACSNIAEPVNCRCSSLLTVCENNSGQYCWGSMTLNKTSGCPSVPESCSSQFNGTASCLCNDNTVLCVDGYNHYCYGTYSGGSASASVALTSLPASGGAASSQTAAATATASGQDGQSSNQPSSGIRTTPSSIALFVLGLVGIFGFQMF
ncbi:hypothetical protein VTP01DRAFT_9127 [Rhizomucor pusillus]|uniref:uncharacterized protein n=1 Tax=Rhizomucor pusillus TaxID=4840 RepID=UPI003744667A